ncbi:kinase-like domain-containing protein [Mariannaea sp. PMI_226]|nr:kinase-like domain-containing protein [Mariannaea sp. PMI_226]
MPSGHSTPEDKTNTQHQGTEHLAINNTRFRRFLTLAAIRTTAKLFSRDGVCIPISRHKIVKTGRVVHLTEAATLKFIAERTSVPVPKVYCAFVRKNTAYIVMERIGGQEISMALPVLSLESREKLFADLRQIFQEIRALPPPPGTGVESCVNGSLRDARNPRSWPRFGPFKTIQEFHQWLRHEFDPSDYPDKEGTEGWGDIKDMIARQDGPWPLPVFTHGDLNPSNILVRGERVVGIIDWESSGWYPNYWEYTSAWCGSVLRTDWRGELQRFLDPMPPELSMEITRQKWWGEW